MADYDDTNRGAMFKNDKKGNENRPDYTGVINVEGSNYRLAAWIKTSKKGAKYMSLSISEENQRRETRPREDFNDDIPW